MTNNKEIITFPSPSIEIIDGIVKIKLMSSSELVTALDRLTRFKYPVLNKTRVYERIIAQNLVFPKINLKNIDKISQKTINAIVSLIWNESVKKLTGEEINDVLINRYLAFEEIMTFSAKNIFKDTADNLVAKKSNNPEKNYIDDCLESPLNILSLLKHLKEKKNKQYPLNIARLLKLLAVIEKEKIQEVEVLYQRQINDKKFNFGYPVRLLVLAEGNTEEKLLPVFCEKYGLDFKQEGIQLIAPGGKNQILKFYTEIRKKINIPVFILLDADGVDIKKPLESILAKKDYLYLIKEGEFEDILQPKLICRAINNFYCMESLINVKELPQKGSMAKYLSVIWKEKGYGEFSKSHFAQIIRDSIKNKNDISPSLQQIIEIIKDMI